MNDTATPVMPTTADQRAHAFAVLVDDWATEGLTSTVYLTSGGTITSELWSLGLDGLLSWEGDGTMHLLDPAQIVVAHLGEPDQRDPKYTR